MLGGVLVYSNASAQDGAPESPITPPVTPPAATPPLGAAEDGDLSTQLPADGSVAAEGDGAADADVVDADAVDANAILENESGFTITDAKINDIFQLLARRAGKQYFHNNQITGPNFNVTGHLNGDTSALKQMEELAFQYGLRLYVKGNTVYALQDEQLARLPAKEWTYQLKYLRPTDIEQIQALVRPLLTPGRGIVNFEPKTNTLIVIDTTTHIETVERVLNKIDRPKGQIVVETKILNVDSDARKRSGVDWSASLGSGVSIEAVRSLNSVFGLGSSTFEAAATSVGLSATGSEVSPGENLIFSPFQLSGILRALNDGNIVTQKSNPIVITEDNESAIISLIDRIPIITSTTTSSNGTVTVSDEVRYTIDESDSVDPETTREIGLTIAVTPSLLPDGTVRMRMRPRTAVVTDNIEGESGNIFPQVTESSVQTIARIPDGHSLIVGGFYSEAKSNEKTKVPLLGDVPVFKFFFKSKDAQKVQSSLVFVVTPTSYNPTSTASNRETNRHLRSHMALPKDHDNVDPRNPGPAHKSNLRRTIRGMKYNDQQPDNYPRR